MEDCLINSEHESASTVFRPFPCGTCLKRFSTVYNLRRHEKNVHQGSPDLACPFVKCPHTFCDWSDLLSHLNMEHERDIPPPNLIIW